jgi:hypothetical protein
MKTYQSEAQLYHSWPLHLIEVSSQLHSRVALSPVQIGGWVSKLWRREKSLAPAANRIPAVQPDGGHYTDWAIPAHITIRFSGGFRHEQVLNKKYYFLKCYAVQSNVLYRSFGRLYCLHRQGGRITKRDSKCLCLLSLSIHTMEAVHSSDTSEVPD